MREIKNRRSVIKYALAIGSISIALIWVFWPQDQFDRRLDGLGAYAVVRIYDTPEDKRKYIFHLGTPQNARADFYISAADIIILSVTDVQW